MSADEFHPCERCDRQVRLRYSCAGKLLCRHCVEEFTGQSLRPPADTLSYHDKRVLGVRPTHKPYPLERFVNAIPRVLMTAAAWLTVARHCPDCPHYIRTGR